MVVSVTRRNERTDNLYKKNRRKEYNLRRYGALEGTRTPDLLVRSQSLYPAELQAQL